MASVIPWVGGRSVYDPFSIDPFDNISGGLLWPRRGSERDDTMAIAQTNVDWRETDDAHVFHADLPGVRREEVKVQVEDGNILQICGERTTEEEDTTDTWHRVERRRGSFLRRFKLPENANMDAARCSLDHGVLTVTVPKREDMEKTGRNVRAIDIA